MSKKTNKKPPKKRKRIAMVQATSIPNQLRKARNYPIKECYITEDWQNKGMCNIYILREKPDHNIVLGVYLIDLWCLGLKDTFCNPDLSYEEIIDRIHSHPTERFIPIDSDLAHSIIYGGIAYAGNLGFKPHSDFKYSEFVLEEMEGIQYEDSVEFGKDGKPFYIVGPYDSKETINTILSQLEEKVGENNFHFIIPVLGF